MATRLIVDPAAERDVLEAARWYEGEKAGLGEAFLDAVQDIYFRISESPRQFPKVHGDIRRALLRRFPYAVFFVLDEETSTVIAVLHQHRDPDSWRARLAP